MHEIVASWKGVIRWHICAEALIDSTYRKGE